jgi:hypothetical protein
VRYAVDPNIINQRVLQLGLIMIFGEKGVGIRETTDLFPLFEVYRLVWGPELELALDSGLVTSS